MQLPLMSFRILKICVGVFNLRIISFRDDMEFSIGLAENPPKPAILDSSSILFVTEWDHKGRVTV